MISDCCRILNMTLFNKNLTVDVNDKALKLFLHIIYTWPVGFCEETA